MKAKYEYDVITKGYGKLVAAVSTRRDARQEKSAYEESSNKKAKIIQRKYILAEEKVVR